MSQPASADPVIVDISPSVGDDADARRVLLEQLRALVAQGATEILLNVAPLTTVSSEQLGAIIQAYIAVTKNGGRLQLLSVTERMRKLLAVTKLDRFIHSADET
jgi:anti-anti-sigma factor